MKSSKLLLILFLAGLTACTSMSTTVNFTETGDENYSSLKSDCDVTIYASRPKRNFDELGIIDIAHTCQSGPFIGYECPDVDKASFVRDLVRGDVCKSGGNAILLWEANGQGRYTKVTVVRVK